MRLLVLGGSHFLGRAIVDEACSRGYDVTTFSRGLSGHRRPGVEALTGDRTNPDDLRQLTRAEWDAAIDTSVLAPAHVTASAQLLAGRTKHYTYISTVSVYADYPREPATEDSPVLDCPRRCHRHPGQPRIWPAQGRFRARGPRRLRRQVPHRPARTDRRAARERPVELVVAGARWPGAGRSSRRTALASRSG